MNQEEMPMDEQWRLNMMSSIQRKRLQGWIEDGKERKKLMKKPKYKKEVDKFKKKYNI